MEVELEKNNERNNDMILFAKDVAKTRQERNDLITKLNLCNSSLESAISMIQYLIIKFDF